MKRWGKREEMGRNKKTLKDKTNTREEKRLISYRNSYLILFKI